MDTLPLHAQDGKTTFIYALLDPRTQQIRYVGKANDPQYRLKNHLREKGKSYKNSWLKELRDNGLKPEIQILEETLVTNWMERERYWITYYRELGLKLVNGTDGGDGVHGMRHTPEARAKISAAGKGNKYSLGRVKTPEETAKRRASLKGHVVAPETAQKISASKLGKPRNPATIAKMRQSLTGRKLSKRHVAKLHQRRASEETRAKISIANKGRKHSEGTKAKLRNRTMSEEHKARLIEINKTRIISDKERAMRRERALTLGYKPPSRKGAKVSEETRAKISAKNQGRKVSKENRLKLIERNKGNAYAKGHKNALGFKHTEEFKAARRDYRHTPEAREKIRLSNLNRPKDPEKLLLAEQIRVDRASGMNYSQLATKYNLNSHAIGRIVRREAWT